MKIVMTVESLSPAAGGTAEVVRELSNALPKASNAISLQVFSHSRKSETMDLNSKSISIECVSIWGHGLARQMEKVGIKDCNILHDHGQWLPINHASRVVASKYSIARVVSPHGMLSPWARTQKRLKKLLAWRLYSRRDLECANVVHATSQLECDELRSFGIRAPIAIIPNGVNPPVHFSDFTKPERPYILFMSRIHKKKGIAELLNVWERLGDKGYELVLAGPDEQGIMASSKLPRNVRYVGMVRGEEKSKLLYEASLFVLPSYSENFGVVVAEAMMAGVPVLTTKNTPWELIKNEKCGWWIDMNEMELERTLVEAMQIQPDQLRAMGQRSKEIAFQEFQWDSVVDKFLCLYHWVLTGENEPDFLNRT